MVSAFIGLALVTGAAASSTIQMTHTDGSICNINTATDPELGTVLVSDCPMQSSDGHFTTNVFNIDSNNGDSTHPQGSVQTWDFTCGSYFGAEVIITLRQTNGGPHNNHYVRGIWHNNHHSHHWEILDDVGGIAQGTTLGFTVTDKDGASVHNSGRLRIDITYGSASFGGGKISVRQFAGSFTGSTHTAWRTVALNSCSEAPSDGPYKIISGGSTFQTYCDVSNGGWMKIYQENALPKSKFESELTGSELNGADLAGAPGSGTWAHVSEAVINTFPHTQVWDKWTVDGTQYAKFTVASGSTWNFGSGATPTSGSGDPSGLAFNYWNYGCRYYASWKLDPQAALFSPTGGTSCGKIPGYGIRSAGSHACGSYSVAPSDSVRARYATGDYSSCYLNKGDQAKEARTIWVK